MRLVHRLVTTAAALVLTATTIAGSTGVASAETGGPVTPTSPGPHAYTFTLPTAASTQSTGAILWDNTTWALSMTATTGQLATGSCLTVYFDWRSTGHHDARGVRNCVSNSSYSFSFPDSNTSNLRGGPSRMGLCYGTQDTQGTCTVYSVVTPSVVPMDWTPWPDVTRTNPCVLSWARRAADGTTASFIDAHSQRLSLEGASC